MQPATRFVICATCIVALAALLASADLRSTAEDVTARMQKFRDMKVDAARSATSYPSWPTGQNEFSVFVVTNRTYYVYVPPGYTPSKPTAVLFAFHGLGDDCLNFAAETGFTAVANQRNFLFVYPCATTGILGNCWNSGVCCCEGNGADDIGFTKAMVAALQDNFNVDSSRIFVCGFSNGAFMAETLSCVAPDLFKASASVSGVVEMVPGNSGGLAACSAAYGNFTQRVSTVNIHGNLDFVVPWTGDALLGFPDIPTNFLDWSQRNGCKGSPVQTFSNGSFSDQMYENCEGGTRVQLIKNNGGGHEWPANADFDTTIYIADFFGL